jgi:hypothetical protein
MKPYKYLMIAITWALIGLAGCNDDFLDLGPLSRINDALFWKTPRDLEIYINNLYSENGLLPNYNSSYYDVIGPYTLDAKDGSDLLVEIEYNKRINGENTLPTSGGGWQTSDWAILRNINYFMAHYQNVDADFSKVSKYVGEALFFRALFYYYKLKRFGALPWASKLIDPNSEELFGNRLPRNELTDSIMLDLDLAIQYLPTRGNGTWTGRVTKETALALQARIALYEGTWEKYHGLKNTPFQVKNGDGGKRFLEKAAAAADTLITMSAANGYPALDNIGQTNGYWNLFNQKDYSTSKEVLFWRKYSTDADQLFNRWINISYTGAGIGITKRLVDQYLCSDGKPIYLSPGLENPLYQGDDSLTTVVRNRDPRLNQTICVPDGKHYRWKPDTYFEKPMIVAVLDTRCVTGYQMYKGHSADKTEYDNRKGTNGCIYFRYGEVLLIYAEAKAELGTITQGDIDITINALRQRAGMPGLLDINDITDDPNWLYETNGPAAVSPLIQEIRRERTVELACEGFRLDDIFRWAVADKLLAGYRPKGAKLSQWPDIQASPPDYVAEDQDGYLDPYRQFAPMDDGYQFNINRDYLYPIPTNELTLNPALRPQNPGW